MQLRHETDHVLLNNNISWSMNVNLAHVPPVCAVQMSFYSIAAKYNGPLEAAHAFIDDDRYDMDS